MNKIKYKNIKALWDVSLFNFIHIQIIYIHMLSKGNIDKDITDIIFKCISIAYMCNIK